MNQKNLLLASIALNIGLIIIIFLVKNNATDQAKEFVKKAQEETKFIRGQFGDNLDNNKLLWTLVDSTWRSSDKSRASVKKLADAQKLPRCKGKPCEGDEARLKTKIDNDKERSITVQGGKYYFKVLYDNKDKFITVDVSDLIGKTSGASLDEPAEEEGGEE
jgi:hypothetical protein